MSGIGLHLHQSSIVHWYTMLDTSLEPIALCCGNRGMKSRRRRRPTLATFCRYLNMLFSHWYKQWKNDLHKHFKLFNYPKVALEEGCLLELGDQANGWAWLCAHFQEPAYLAKVNKINWDKKTLLHHSGSRPFSYRMEARQQGFKIP